MPAGGLRGAYLATERPHPSSRRHGLQNGSRRRVRLDKLVLAEHICIGDDCGTNRLAWLVFASQQRHADGTRLTMTVANYCQ
jgi:hypothetical protein